MKIWRLERQLAGFLVFAAIVIILVGGLIYYVWPGASCTDGVQNGSEEGIDCGGGCQKQCVGIVQDPVKHWARYFPIRDGMYDAAALVENVNVSAAATKLDYTFKFYDADNVVITSRSGSTFLYPAKKMLVFEPMVNVSWRVPAYIEFVPDYVQWEILKPEVFPMEIEVSGKQFVSDPDPRVVLKLTNKSLFEERNIEVAITLDRADGNTYAVSRTVVDIMRPESSKDVSFLWPGILLEKPASITVYVRRVIK